MSPNIYVDCPGAHKNAANCCESCKYWAPIGGQATSIFDPPSYFATIGKCYQYLISFFEKGYRLCDSSPITNAADSRDDYDPF